MMCKIICFSGIDGSGKSSHARLIFKELKANGIRCKYKWLRYTNFFSLIPLTLYHTYIRTPNSPKTQISFSSETHFQTSTVINTLWTFFQLMDALLFSARYVYLPALLGYTLILDRFIVDTLVDIAFSLKNQSLLSSKLGKLFVRIIPKNSLVMIFDVDENIAISRKNDISEIDYLVLRRKLYHLMTETYVWQIINTHKPFDEVHDEVMEFVLLYLARAQRKIKNKC